MNREIFEQKIIDDWVKYFDSSKKEFETSGSKIIARNKYAKNLVIIAHAGQKTFIQYNPDVEGRVKELTRHSPSGMTLTAEHFISYFENENIRINNIDKLFYLHLPDLKTFTLDECFIIRKLVTEDEHYLNELNNSCSEEEVDNSFVEIDELGVWGCYFDNKLVAAAGFSDWGLYGDLGVITHPEFRRRGLGKAVVSAACKEIFEIGRIPVYRCHITLFQSINTAKSIGFRIYPKAYFKMEVLKYSE